MTAPSISSPAITAAPPESPAELRKQRLIIAGSIAAAVIVVAGVVVATYYLGGHPGTAETVRDIAIIFAAVVMIFIMLALAVLIVQLARLTNLLQHEIKPILDSTNETVNTVRGTAKFLSENLTEPVVKLNSYIAAVQKVLDLLKIGGLGK